MDHQNQEVQSIRSGSFGRLSGASSSRRLSFSVSFALSSQHDDDFESERVAEAGDIGDRALHSSRTSASGRSSHFSLENGIVVPIEEDLFRPSSGTSFPGPKETDEKEVPWLLGYVTSLLSLAVFGILGVLARYCLKKLFEPNVIDPTRDWSYMFFDLPYNMVGSFLMGWFGVVFKGDILKVSDQLGIGLTTGFLGSLTTFSSWNQNMLQLSVNGHWVFAVLGILLGLFLVEVSIVLGVYTAKGFRWIYRRSNIRFTTCQCGCISNKFHFHLTFMVMLLVMLGVLWGIFGSLEKKDFETGGSKAQLFLACLVGPFGVWIRWFLARFNGRGLGKSGKLKWMPFGTIAANVIAACVMAALATIKKAVDTKNCDTVASGIQFGMLGCLSTVSTFIAEFHAMIIESKHRWRAFAYPTITFAISFVLGTLIYSVPVWAKGYD